MENKVKDIIIKIYKAPPTAQGQWVSAYDNRNDYIYETVGLDNKEVCVKERS